MKRQSVAWTLSWPYYLIFCVGASSCWAAQHDHRANLSIDTLRFDPVIVPVNTSQPAFLTIAQEIYTASGPPRQAYWVHTNHPFRVVNPPPIEEQFWQENHHAQGWQLWKTSDQSSYFGCNTVAVNGGPFHADGTSCGPVVVDGVLLQGSGYSGDLIGIGRTNHSKWVLGSYQQFMDETRAVASRHGSLQSFVTGFHWLVYNGTVVARDDDDGHGAKIQRAARTAIGTTRDGSLVILVVDGCEKCTHNPGVSLTELARLILQRSELNVLFATNLDGGGSTTLVHHHMIKNRPRCLDVDFVPCERRVASVVCLAIPVEELELGAVLKRR